MDARDGVSGDDLLAALRADGKPHHLDALFLRHMERLRTLLYQMVVHDWVDKTADMPLGKIWAGHNGWGTPHPTGVPFPLYEGSEGSGDERDERAMKMCQCVAVKPRRTERNAGRCNVKQRCRILLLNMHTVIGTFITPDPKVVPCTDELVPLVGDMTWGEGPPIQYGLGGSHCAAQTRRKPHSRLERYWPVGNTHEHRNQRKYAHVEDYKIRTQIKHNMRWFVPAVMLLLSEHMALCGMPPTVNNVFRPLTHAVEQDDNEAYHAARATALELDEQEFDILINALEKTETWQALAMQGGLRVRRQHPGLAVQFDKHLDWLRNNPVAARMGPLFHWRDERSMFASSEGDWLRYEAVLTAKADMQTDAMGIPGWIAFRRSVFNGGARHADDLRFLIMMLRDVPGWTHYGQVAANLSFSVQRSSSGVDEYVPELVEHYKRNRKGKVFVSREMPPFRPDMFIFYSLARAIAEADTDVALPALTQIREFEQTTGEDIQSQATVLRARLQEVDELHTQAMREGREDDARKLAMERRELETRDVSLDASQLGAVRRELDKLIERHQKAAEDR